MKTALITTTINIPYVLKLYRACAPDVAFFVTGDLKTPARDENNLLGGIGDIRYYAPEEQKSLGYACSDLIGWNTISRRNLALLEALKWGAEIIITIDDDNLPMSTVYFDWFEATLGSPFSGLKAAGSEWFDPGCLLHPHARHRGFPFLDNATPSFDFTVNAKVGVAAGMCLGDPDISAVDRISQRPIVQNVSQLAVNGVVVDPTEGRWTVFNSQNTAFTRKLAPCFLMVPQFKRYDDIFASLVAQRVMRELNQVVHFGQPFVWQQRNPHDLLKDLDAETWGMRHVVEFAEWLDGLTLYQIDKFTPVDQVSLIYDAMQDVKWMPEGVTQLGMAWVEDCRKVLG